MAWQSLNSPNEGIAKRRYLSEPNTLWGQNHIQRGTNCTQEQLFVL